MQKPRSHLRRNIVRVLAVLMVLGLLWAAVDLRFVVDGAEVDSAAPADVILVLGCHIYEDEGISNCIQARAAHAAEVYGRGLAPMVIASGGKTQTEASEASVLAQLLEKGGVPADKILLEDNSYNTIQNIRNSKVLMQSHNWTSMLLVTEPNHINRAALIARDNGLTVYPSPAVASPNWQNLNHRTVNLIQAMLSMMLYDAKRVTGNADR